MLGRKLTAELARERLRGAAGEAGLRSQGRAVQGDRHAVTGKGGDDRRLIAKTP